MTELFALVIACGLIALAYGILASRSIVTADAGNEKMQQIASAIQEGAAAYLNRQYLTIGGVGFILAAISSYTGRDLLPLGNPSSLLFIPQGIIMGAYGVIANLLNIYLWYLVFINFGSGHNFFDKDSQSVEIKRKGLFKDVEVKLDFDEIKSVKLDISEGFNPRRRIALVLKGRKKALPLSGAGELKPLLQVEEEGARLAKFLNVNLEGLK